MFIFIPKTGKADEMRKKNFETGKERAGAYQKTVLYIYPHIKKMAAALSTSLQTQAVLSYRAKESAEKVVERLLIYDFQQRFLLQTAERIARILKEFTAEELFLLEYRYFRRKKILRAYEEHPFLMSLRTFYRRQNAVLKKFSAVLRREGMDEKWFADNFTDMDWVMTVYKKVLDGKDSYILGKYKNSPFFHGATAFKKGVNLKEEVPMSV